MQLFVNIHRRQLRLVEARQVFVGDDQQPVIVGVEFLSRLTFGESIHIGFRVFHPIDGLLARKRDQYLERVFLIVEQLGHRFVIADRGFDVLGDDHPFGLAAQLLGVHDLRDKMIQHDLGLGVDRLLTAFDIGAQLFLGLLGVEQRVF